MGLRTFTDAEIHEEAMRRTRCKGRHVCTLCGQRLDEGNPCQRSDHKQPFPAHIATEAALQGIASTIDKSLPSGRGFVLSVVHTTEGGTEGSFGSYVSNIPSEVVPEHLRETANYIEERDARRKAT